MRFKFLLLIGFFALSNLLTGQDAAPENWFNLDPSADRVPGVSTEKVYKELLKGFSPKKTVVVAVIDSGVDPLHEDLKDVMWVNEDEIPGNGKDDDKNGYVDDVHGWNFIGGKNGNVNQDNLEITRLVAKYKKQFEGKTAADLSGKERKLFEKYKKMEADVQKEAEKGKANYDKYAGVYESLVKLKKEFANKEVTAEMLESYQTTDPNMQQALGIAGNAVANGGTLDGLVEDLKGYTEYLESKFKYHYNLDFNPRGIVGDDYNNVYEKGYGNNDVKGPDASHGTHVAGIIAASRGNGVGMEGVANNVRIMSVRAVPDGDERDKDVANAIIYAVDNGASIINMSFGKGYAWNKEAVDKAVKYAESKDVLLVHAAGNDAKNNDETDNFPNDKYGKAGFFSKKRASNWLEVGALSWKWGEKAPATFTNYGAKNVDVFAPGVDIYSTTPDQGYASFSGTSMASPVTAGVAAVLRSYFPDLTAEQVKDIIMDSVSPVHNQVIKPGTEELVDFNNLSVTGGVVNVYKAVVKAANTKGKKPSEGRSIQSKDIKIAKSKIVLP